MTAALSPSTGGCSTPGADGSYSCTVNAFLPVGTNQYVVALLDRAPTSGPPSPPPFFPTGTNVLSFASVSFTVANNTTNTIPLTLSGIIAGFAITPSLVTVPSGVATSLPVTVTAYDADSNIIIGPGNYSTPLSVSIADTSGSLTFAGGATTVSLASPSPPLTLNYNGGALSSGTITATANGLTAAVNVLPASANAVSIDLPNAGAATTLVAVGGIRTYIGFPSNNAPAGTTVTVGSQLAPPPGVPAAASVARSVMVAGGRQPQAVASSGATPSSTASPAVLQYIVTAPSNSFTLNGAPVFNFTGTFDPTLSYYMGFYNPSNPAAGYSLIEGPGTFTGTSTLSFAGTSVPLALTGGQQAVFALLAFSVAPTPAPSAPVGIGIGIPGAQSQAIYVADYEASEVLRFGANVLGTPAPTFTLPASYSSAVTFDLHANMYVASFPNTGPQIAVYAPVSGSTTGAYQATPFATIAGASTQLEDPVGLNTDASGKLYVADVGKAAILIFAADANGNVAPSGTIPSGSTTQIGVPESVVIDPNNNIWVSSIGSGTSTSVDGVLEFAAGTSGSVAPIRTIYGAATKLQYPSSVTLDYAGDVIVGDLAPSTGATSAPTVAQALRLLRSSHNVRAAVAATSAPTTSPGAVAGAIYVFAPPFAIGNNNVAPTRTIVGSGTGIFYPSFLAADAYGNIDIANLYAASVEVFAPNANGNAAPIKVISGAPTGLQAPAGIAISPVQP